MYSLSNRTHVSCRTPGRKWLPVKLSTEEQRKSLCERKPTETKFHNKWKNKDRKRYCKWNATSVKQKGKKLYEQEIIRATVRVDFVLGALIIRTLRPSVLCRLDFNIGQEFKILFIYLFLLSSAAAIAWNHALLWLAESLWRERLSIDRFHMTSHGPCPKTIKRWSCWCFKPLRWKLNIFFG